MSTFELMDYLRSKCDRVEAVGSRVTCDPAPMDTDEDWLVLTSPEKFKDLELVLMIDFGMEFGGSRVHAGGCLTGDPDSFQSYTYGEINVIATASQEFFDKFMQATTEAKRLNLLVKSDRIALFQKILYGVEIPPAPAPFDIKKYLDGSDGV